MHRSLMLALCVGTFVTAASVPSRTDAGRDRPAQVRFANHIPGARTWTLAARGAPVFSDVAPEVTTAYQPVADSLARLDLRAAGKDSAVATTTYLFVSGSYYTVTASMGNGGQPMLGVERDRSPEDSVPGSPPH